MIRFNVQRATTPTFTPVTINLTIDSAAELVLVTNLFGGVPADSPVSVNDLAAALRTACDASGIEKTFRKGSVGYNWGKKLREALAAVDAD